MNQEFSEVFNRNINYFSIIILINFSKINWDFQNLRKNYEFFSLKKCLRLLFIFIKTHVLWFSSKEHFTILWCVVMVIDKGILDMSSEVSDSDVIILSWIKDEALIHSWKLRSISAESHSRNNLIVETQKSVGVVSLLLSVFV